jgi:hypothetical protein
MLTVRTCIVARRPHCSNGISNHTVCPNVWVTGDCFLIIRSLTARPLWLLVALRLSMCGDIVAFSLQTPDARAASRGMCLGDVADV